MSTRVLRHGDWKQRVVLFTCDRCGCLFESDDYEKYGDCRTDVYVRVRCPECEKPIARTLEGEGSDGNGRGV